MVNSTKTIKIVHLYPEEMNIYGDRGNIIALQYRAGLMGVTTSVIACGIDDKLPRDADIIVAGGGQDSGQQIVQLDLSKKSNDLKALFNDGVAGLAVCGMYQLLGHRFITADNKVIEGLSYFDMTTVAGAERLVGNVVINTEFGKLVGFENHSGKTRLSSSQPSFGRVIKGSGNNGTDKLEGAVLNNVFGTYLHGPILPKNPKLTDELIKRAFLRKYGRVDTLNNTLDSGLEELAARVAMSRP